MRTYLDWNSTAPLRREARDAMLGAMSETGNPSSVHAEGRRARAIVEQARDAVARLAGARASEVVFTSGGTEANNMALAGRWRRILVSAVEHASVLEAARRTGADVVVVPVDADGRVVTEALARALAGAPDASDTLLSVQLANNETGVIQHVAELARMAKAAGAAVHMDAVQAAGRIPVEMDVLGVDLVSLSAHKIGGPKGVGALVVRDGLEAPVLIAGGGQEGRRRGGTENVIGIAGYGAAAACALDELSSMASVGLRRRALETALAEAIPGAFVVGEASERLPNTMCLVWPGRLAETLLIRLDLEGFAVSSGAACSSGKVASSHVLEAMGLADDLCRSALRVSIGGSTSPDDLERFGAVMASIAAQSAGKQAAVSRNSPGAQTLRHEMMMGEA